MASGWGITSNKGRCYYLWVDFSEYMSHCRELKDCVLLREDYLECLHHSKECLKSALMMCAPPALEDSRRTRTRRKRKIKRVKFQNESQIARRPRRMTILVQQPNFRVVEVEEKVSESGEKNELMLDCGFVEPPTNAFSHTFMDYDVSSEM
ncbi:hypothetical protein PS2_026426 [Malus domestica]